MSDNCPKCGAEEVTPRSMRDFETRTVFTPRAEWECGAYLTDEGEFVQPVNTCRIRELEQQVESLKQQLAMQSTHDAYLRADLGLCREMVAELEQQLADVRRERDALRQGPVDFSAGDNDETVELERHFKKGSGS